MNNIQLAEDMTPPQIENALAVFSNELATLAVTVAGYENIKADAELKFRRAYAVAIINNQRGKNVMLIKALAERDSLVIAAGDELAKATATLTLGKATFDGLESKYVALRKIANLKQTELTSMGGFK